MRAAASGASARGGGIISQAPTRGRGMRPVGPANLTGERGSGNNRHQPTSIVACTCIWYLAAATHSRVPAMHKAMDVTGCMYLTLDLLPSPLAGSGSVFLRLTLAAGNQGMSMQISSRYSQRHQTSTCLQSLKWITSLPVLEVVCQQHCGSPPPPATGAGVLGSSVRGTASATASARRVKRGGARNIVQL